ncbi:MAG: PAS domain S-box protein, partial [Proteobacteria bacterium]|nr:PAS domain S-box protein [Pseudomonadota bacterium]
MAIGLTRRQALAGAALCRSVMTDSVPIVALDIAHDSRFADTPLAVSEPFVAFYVGARLVAADGNVLGMLSVMDTRPRRLSARQRDLLSALARQIPALCEPSLHLRATATSPTQGDADVLAAKRLAAIVESSQDAITSLDLQGNVTSWNASAEEIYGYSASEMIGRPIRTIIPVDQQDGDARILRAVAHGERLEHMQTVRTAKDGRQIDVLISASPIRDANGTVVGISRIARDISSLLLQGRDAQQLSRLYHALSQINQAIVWKKTREELLLNVCRILVENAGFALAWIGWHDPATREVKPIAVHGDEHGYLREIRVFSDDRAEGHGPVGIAFRTGHRHLCNDTLHDAAMRPWHAALARANLRAAAAFPIRANGDVGGTLTVYATDVGFFREREIALLEEAATDIAFGLENLERELAAREAHVAAQQERRFSDALLDSVPGILYLFDENFHYLRWNRQLETVTGYAHAEIARMHPLDFYAGTGNTALVESRIAEVFARGEGEVEAHFLTKDGRSLPYLLTGRRVQLDGRACLVGIGIDISARIAAEEARRLSDASYRRLFEHDPDGILLIDRARVFADANPAMCRLLGSSRDDLVGRTPADIVDPAALPQYEAALESIGAGEDSHAQWIFVRVDGTRVHVEASATLMPDGNILAVIRDISDRKLAEEQLRQSEDRFRAVFERAGLGIAILDAHDGRLLRVNPMAAKMLGSGPDELATMTAAQVSEPESEAARALREQLLRGEIDHYQIEKKYRRKDGSELWGVLTSTLVHGSDGKPEFAISLLEDRTKQKEQERRLSRLNRTRVAIGRIHSAMLRQHDRDGLFRDACRVANYEGAFVLAWIAAVDPERDDLRVAAVEGRDADATRFVEYLRHATPPESRLDWRAVHEARSVIVNNLLADTALLATREQLLQLGIQSAVAMPLLVSGKPIAALVLLAEEADFFDADETALLEWLAHDLSYALEHADTAQKLEQLTFYDALTGLRNAHAFRESLLQLEEVVRSRKMCLYVCAMDLENFTQLNARYGRVLCDKLLREIAERLRRVTGDSGMLARVGGDTFTAVELFPDNTAAGNFVDRLLAAFTAPFRIDDQELAVSVQAGIALYPDDESESDTSFNFDNAETALKLSKSSGERVT